MSECFVLFADMLGFASLVLENPESVGVLSPRLGSPSKEERTALQAGDMLVTRFREFHKAVSGQIGEHLRPDSKAIVFSDSVFVALKKLPDLMGFARGLMWRFLSHGIPARMGIAYGSFAALRYASDIAGEAATYSTQFLGTGVVQAYQAERAVKGIAVCIHSSILRFEDQLHPSELLRLPAPVENAFGIGNFIYHGIDNAPNHRATRYQKARQSLNAMRRKSTREFHVYYDFALQNLDAMRDG
jgi:hypothetical protein